jgi:phosphoglycerate kinase
LKALGENIGSIEVEQKNLTIVRNILSKSKNKAKIILPIDHIAILKCNKNSTTRIVNKNTFKKNEIGLDIGPKTIALYKHEIGKTGTVFWNGPMGVFELTKFAKGTFAIAKIIAEFNGVTIIGGGESTSVISILKLNNKISHISTGGGASISFLVGNKLTTLNKLGFYD